MKKLSQEEAAKVLEDMKVKIEIPKAAVMQWKRNTALDMAIEALRCSEIPNSSDCISRQTAIDELKRISFSHCFECGEYLSEDTREIEIINSKKALEVIEALPSAQPETAKRIVGRSRNGMTLWYQCDMCNEPVDAQDNFCRECGRRLTDG